MNMYLWVVMGVTTFAIIVSLLFVAFTSIMLQRGWKFVIFDEEYDEEEEPAPAKEPVHYKNVERVPGGVYLEDIEIGDTVFIETVTGSRYRFTLLCPESNTYHLHGESASKKETFNMDVLVPQAFVPKRRLLFWTVDKVRDISTSRIVRILIDKPQLAVAN